MPNDEILSTLSAFDICRDCTRSNPRRMTKAQRETAGQLIEKFHEEGLTLGEQTDLGKIASGCQLRLVPIIDCDEKGFMELHPNTAADDVAVIHFGIDKILETRR